jgi:hypothetical protein
MSADALELALALHQAPIQRFALRDRPLPENIDAALQLASATQPQLADAAAMFSESEEVMLEAVRFYLHQVLFEPGTDAYRVLGLAPHADSKQIRQHYMLLQRWLHPDRRGEDWEAVFTTKVNWAWQQLRNQTSREEYDRSHAARGARTADVTPDAGPISTPAWSSTPVQHAPRTRLRSTIIGGLIAACVGLFYLAVTREDVIESEFPVLQSERPDSSIQSSAPFVAESIRVRNAPDSPFSVQSQPVSTQSGATQRGDQAATDSMAGDVIQSSSFGQQEGGTRLAMESAATASGVPEVHSGRDSQGSPSASATTKPGPRITKSERRLDGDAVEAIVAEPADPGARSQPRQNVTNTKPRTKLAKASGNAESSQNRSATQAAVVGSDLAQATTSGNGPTDSVTAQEESDQAAAVAEATPGVSEPSSKDTLQRFELARERLRSMISFFRSPSTSLPEWDDGQGRLSAERVRKALHSRNSAAEIDRFALDPPTWRVSNAAVALESTYHVEAKSKVFESGRFFLDMAWRDGSWKITRIEVSPSR